MMIRAPTIRSSTAATMVRTRVGRYKIVVVNSKVKGSRVFAITWEKASIRVMPLMRDSIPMIPMASFQERVSSLDV